MVSAGSFAGRSNIDSQLGGLLLAAAQRDCSGHVLDGKTGGYRRLKSQKQVANLQAVAEDQLCKLPPHKARPDAVLAMLLLLL